MPVNQEPMSPEERARVEQEQLAQHLADLEREAAERADQHLRDWGDEVPAMIQRDGIRQR